MSLILQQLKYITEVDVFLESLDELLLITEDTKKEGLNIPDSYIGYMAIFIPTKLIVAYLERIDILQGGTQRAINETQLEAIPAYIGDGQPDDPDEYSKQDLEELESLYAYLHFLNVVENAFINELFDREAFINNI